MLTIVTYNILHDYFADLIIKNVRFLVGEGVDIIGFQEADPAFASFLNSLFAEPALSHWQVIYFHDGPACNLAVAWNSERATLQHSQAISLPTLSKPTWLQRSRGRKVAVPRGALSANFLAGDKEIRFTTAHLSWEGGIRRRLLQLGYLREVLGQKPADRDILLGDFNTYAPDAFRRFQEKKVEAVLGPEWLNALPNLLWSEDISYYAPQDGWFGIIKFLRALGIMMRARLDYIFVRNLKVKSAVMQDMPGSDHRPLLAKLDF